MRINGIYMGLSENSVPPKPNGFADHYPIKWLFHWEYTLFSDTPIYEELWHIGIFFGMCSRYS